MDNNPDQISVHNSDHSINNNDLNINHELNLNLGGEINHPLNDSRSSNIENDVKVRKRNTWNEKKNLALIEVLNFI